MAKKTYSSQDDIVNQSKSWIKFRLPNNNNKVFLMSCDFQETRKCANEKLLLHHTCETSFTTSLFFLRSLDTMSLLSLLYFMNLSIQYYAIILASLIENGKNQLNTHIMLVYPFGL